MHACVVVLRVIQDVLCNCHYVVLPLEAVGAWWVSKFQPNRSWAQQLRLIFFCLGMGNSGSPSTKTMGNFGSIIEGHRSSHQSLKWVCTTCCPHAGDNNGNHFWFVLFQFVRTSIAWKYVGVASYSVDASCNRSWFSCTGLKPLSPGGNFEAPAPELIHESSGMKIFAPGGAQDRLKVEIGMECC